jgi:DeoR/GlpR family transcriptional regulator of sugar metabolism
VKFLQLPVIKKIEQSAVVLGSKLENRNRFLILLASLYHPSYTLYIMNRKEIRKEQVLHQLDIDGQVQVVALAEKLQVSQVTIRQDLMNLEKQGLLQRVHGGAIQHVEDDISNRLAVDYALKMKIASKATALVNDGETVFIESGSTCCLLAFQLGKQKKDVTILTNSNFIAHYVRNLPALHVTLLGGDYQTDSEACVGPLARKNISQYFTDKCFFGIDGFDTIVGFSGCNQARAEIVASMHNQCNTMIALSTSKKFGKRGIVKLVETTDVDIVITDAALPIVERGVLESFGITILTSEENEF